ncbi:12801_t:CDS:2, partial [Entrophospora sp. SA101]
ILKLKHIRIISSWIDKKDQYFYNNTKNLPFTFKLLFSTTRDGFSIRKFHRLCDDKGSTLTITRLNNDHQIIGGYNPVNWKPFDELKTFDKKDIIIARVHDSNNAIFYNSQTGPGFGSGPDLYIKNNLLISFHSSTYPDIEKITNSSQAYEIEKYEVVLRYGFNDLSKRMFGKSRKILEEKGNEYKKSNYHFNELSSSSSLEEKIENRTDEMLYESFFRGRRLIGKKINLEQNNYEGHIFKESSMITSATSSEMELEEEKEQEIVVEKTRNWETVKKFDSFLVWQHNEIPKTSNDQIIKSLEWIKIANIVSTV